MAEISAGTAPRPTRRLIYRHSLAVRITHWVTVLSVIVLLMSGLQIFNAHPALYWGIRSDFDQPLLAMNAMRSAEAAPTGVTVLFGHRFDTTGLFGVSRNQAGQWEERGFPSWTTLPSYQDLATGRRWHFFFAWLLVLAGLVYLIHSLAGRHFWKDLLPSRSQLRSIPRSIWDHLRLRFPEGEEATRYNVLQKLSYLAVAFLLIPALVLAGLAMSPGLDAAFPWLLDLFGGRQSARTVHFIAASLLVLFVIVHVVMVLISGVWNNLRSMVTGRYAVTGEPDER